MTTPPDDTAEGSAVWWRTQDCEALHEHLKRHDPPADATCGERVAILGVAHGCRWPAHGGGAHACVCGCTWRPHERGCEAVPTAPVTAEGLRERLIQVVLAAGREVDVNAVRAIAADLAPELERLRADRDEWKQAAGAEADLADQFKKERDMYKSACESVSVVIQP